MAGRIGFRRGNSGAMPTHKRGQGTRRGTDQEIRPPGNRGVCPFRRAGKRATLEFMLPKRPAAAVAGGSAAVSPPPATAVAGSFLTTTLPS